MLLHEGSHGSGRRVGVPSGQTLCQRSRQQGLCGRGRWSSSTLAGAALALLCVVAPATAAQSSDSAQQPPIQARPGGPEASPRSDQTVDVTKGTRLVLSNNAGEVVVRSWDRDQVRVQATHNERVTLDVTTADNTVRVRTRAARGPAGLVDYLLTVPRWMPVNLSGTYLESTIEGTTAEVTVESVHGNIRVVGGTGTINVRSVQGTITVEKASGNVRATTVNEGIRLSNVSGDVYAETTNGDIEVENAQTTSLEISTVNGDVTFNGTLRDGGSCRMTTHGGDLRVGLGGVTNATVFVRTFQGDFTADFPIQLPEGQSAREGSKRFNFTLGSGSARIELQTFNGDIRLARKAIVSPQEMRRQREGAPKPQPSPKVPGMLDFHVDVDVTPAAPDLHIEGRHERSIHERPHAPPPLPAAPLMEPPPTRLRPGPADPPPAFPRAPIRRIPPVSPVPPGTHMQPTL